MAPPPAGGLRQLMRKLNGTRGSEAALVGITMVWGTTFLAVHTLLGSIGPLMLTGLRFAFATAALLVFSAGTLRGITRRELLAGSLVGVAIFLGYGLQATGMESIASSKSAFITALYVPLVPILQWAVVRRRPHVMAWVGIGFAFAGLLLLAGPDGTGLGLGRGEVLTLIATVAIAAEILLVGGFAGKVDVRRVSIIQLAVASTLCFALMPVTGESVSHLGWGVIAATALLGFASALIQVTMNWAQRKVSPTRATVIYAGEPVWAGLVGRLAGERLPALAILGAALIVVGVLVSELRFKAKAKAAA
ncbi:MAG: EamA family transporter [Rhizobiales bacterium 17-65-6]|nr:MAG: EamA family transporter [Rhizobiales bacterium 17-65-6]